MTVEVIVRYVECWTKVHIGLSGFLCLFSDVDIPSHDVKSEWGDLPTQVLHFSRAQPLPLFLETKVTILNPSTIQIDAQLAQEVYN
jgi:hypothetical protein